MVKVKFFFVAFALWVVCSSAKAREDSALGVAPAIPVMPLAEVVPGMTGIWKTVVSGTQIDTFNLKIIGIADNFVGPKQSIIIAEALDASQVLNGPVAGMSGSPVYIDGKLIGAYAYGFLWPKEQAIIGITPIESMQAILDIDAEGAQEAALRRMPMWSHPAWSPATDTALNAGGGEASVNPAQDVLPWAMRTPHEALSDVALNAALKAVPTPLMVAGVSSQTLAAFVDKFQARGVDVMQAPVGSAQALTEASLEPGAAVAGVLMDGDFSFARVGTVTWRQGDTVLAFGHAMDGVGPVVLPMAPAEVITVVRSLQDSFKLSNVGAPVGMIFQDRLAGVAGKVGQVAPTTPMKINLKLPTGATRAYRGNLATDRSLTPLIAAIAVLEALTATLDAAVEQTFVVAIHMAVRDQEDVFMREVVSGQGAAMQLAFGFMEIYDNLLNNPFAAAEVLDIAIAIDVKSGWRQSSLQAIERLSGPAERGGALRIAATLDHYRAASTREIIVVPLPESIAPQELQVLIADAAVTQAYDGGAWGEVASLAGLIDHVNRRRSSQKLYIKLLQASAGIRIDDTDLYNLPPSVRKLMQSPRSVRAKQSKVMWKTIWESEIDVGGPVAGSHRLGVTLQ